MPRTRHVGTTRRTVTSQSRRVLVVDDEPDIRGLLGLTLEMSGYGVVMAEDGYQAEALARQLMLHAIVLDVMMPGRDGMSVLRALRTNPLTEDIPVVLLTAKRSDDDIWAGWESGASYYMTKPLDNDHLIEFLDGLTQPEDYAVGVR